MLADATLLLCLGSNWDDSEARRMILKQGDFNVDSLRLWRAGLPTRGVPRIFGDMWGVEMRCLNTFLNNDRKGFKYDRKGSAI